jgi:hypothetical protein
VSAGRGQAEEPSSAAVADRDGGKREHSEWTISFCLMDHWRALGWLGGEVNDLLACRRARCLNDVRLEITEGSVIDASNPGGITE